MPRKHRKPSNSSHIHIFRNPDDLISDTTGEERFHIFEVCASLSKYIASLLMATAAVSTFLFLQCFMGVNMSSIPLLKLAFIIAIGFIGIANIICGLVLLSKE
ncbi:MAG: hypothetical protein QXY88_03410 [Candidatus Bathyarchaeia archaeon]